MKSYGRVLWFITILLCVGLGTAFAIRPSGPGINTKANSLSVAVATDQPSYPVTVQGASKLSTVTPSDATDAGTFASCTHGLYIAGDAGAASNVAIIPFGQDASTTLVNVQSGQTLPLNAGAVKSTGTTAVQVVCLGVP